MIMCPIDVNIDLEGLSEIYEEKQSHTVLTEASNVALGRTRWRSTILLVPSLRPRGKSLSDSQGCYVKKKTFARLLWRVVTKYIFGKLRPLWNQKPMFPFQRKTFWSTILDRKMDTV